jgi:acetyl esterase/lipase
VDIAKVDPGLQSATVKSPKLNLENRFMRMFAATASSLIRGKDVEGVERRIERSGGVTLRVYVPANPSGAGLLWVHGGGLVLGAAAMDDTLCGETARETGVTIVSVDYRLAPKHPFPAAIDDCWDGWKWLLRNLGELGLDAERLAIGGQSAGGGLAANLVQRAIDEGDHVAAQWLFCPMLDDRTAADRSHDGIDHFIWNNRSNLVGWSSYLPGMMGADTVPPYAAAARRADFTGFPPTWMYTSDIELFHGEDVEYARRLSAADVDVTLDIVSGAPHGFEAWAPDSEMAQSLVARARDWLAASLSA